MEITTRMSGTVAVVKLERGWTADEFRDALRTLFESGHKRVVVVTPETGSCPHSRRPPSQPLSGLPLPGFDKLLAEA
jgi:hypothetical protein